MHYNNDFPFDIKDIVFLLGLHVRHKGAASWDIDCPFCSFKKGKLNVNLQKNTFRCNYCGEQGGMLRLYGQARSIDNVAAYKEIKDALGKEARPAGHISRNRKKPPGRSEPAVAAAASDSQKHAAYSSLLSLLCLTDIHRDKLLERGFTAEQIEENRYRSTPAFGYRKLAERVAGSGCDIKGVPGFYQEPDGAWSVKFNAKGTGILIPVRNIDGYIVGIQIRLDKAFCGCKYIWLSSVNKHMGASPGSPVHFVGDRREETVYVTEGPLKGDLAHALSGRTFGCIPGVNQHASLQPFLMKLKEGGIKLVYEAYDMDKFLDCACRKDYGSRCNDCGHNFTSSTVTGQGTYICEQKKVKRSNIQRGCRKFRQLCSEMSLPYEVLTWDIDEKGRWAGNIKGIDDYLYADKNAVI